MAKAIEPTDSAADRLGKSLPAEVTGLYVSVRSLFIDNPPRADTGYVLVVVGILMLMLAILYIVKVRNVTNPLHIIIYAVTFGIWALTLDPDRAAAMLPADFSWYFTRGTTALSLVWSVAVPLMVPSNVVASRTS